MSAEQQSAQSSASGPSFPDPSMQNYVHELAKTLPPPRKQNTACDACRSRKVKCHRLPGLDKCQHCTSKNYPCTNFVQQATSEKKRTNTSRRPKAAPSTSSSNNSPTQTTQTSNIEPPPSEATETKPSTPPQPVLPVAVRYGLSSQITTSTPTRTVLEYLLSPPETLFSTPIPGTSTAYAPWGEKAYQLNSEQFRVEFMMDLVEVFFQIVHTRIPLLAPVHFRRRLLLNRNEASTSSNNEPIHPAILAAVIAWGAKYSEHPLLVADRQRPGGQSALAKALVDRARDLAEGLKVHRIPSADHVVACLLLEPLQNQNPEDPAGYHGFWLTTAIRHLFNLQVNHKATMSQILDTEKRGTLIFAWWMALISDAYAAAYYRRKPILDDDDYDIDFYTDTVPPHVQEDLSQEAQATNGRVPSTREQLEFLGYYRAAHALARISRQMSRQLWKPSTDSDGAPFQQLKQTFVALTEWRDAYLKLVGVPKNYSGNWNFVEAVSSCASDATYHVMWVILFGAVDDFGMKEVNDVLRVDPSAEVPHMDEIKEFKQKLAHEALHAALRIAGLTSVLSRNGYLRLDTAVVHVAIIEAGRLLARLGRPEVANCIEGLMQYSYSYEETGEAALEIKRIFDGVQNTGEPDLHHMGSHRRMGGNSPSVPSASPPQPQHSVPDSGNHLHDAAMMVDEATFNSFASEPLF